jgi:3-oxoacyl-[acyl-carrier protein] reductase
MTFNFTNKNVMITGGSRGIGRATALLFAEAGANVHIIYQNNHEAAKATLNSLKTGNHHSYALDITDAAALENFFETFQQEHGGVDILVNNAGIFESHPITQTAYSTWQDVWNRTLQANLVAPANLCYFASKQMIKKKAGKIVNISSRGAFRGEPDCPAYGASKAGLNAMSQSLAIALAPFNISVHIIAPGFVETEMAEESLQGESGDMIKKQSPFNRVAQPEEVAQLVAVYASEALTFTSAGIVDINGASYLRS